MQLNKRTLLTTTIACAALIGSLFVGIALGRSPQLLGDDLVNNKQAAREAILDKLEQTAQQQTQASQSLLDPFAQFSLGGDPFTQMQQRMGQLFGSIGPDPALFNLGSMGFNGSFASISPAQIAVEESKDEYRVVISLAEGSEVELATELDDNTLAISAKVHSAAQNHASGRQISSTSVSQFSRAIPFDTPVDATGLQTEKSANAVVIRVPKLT